MFIERGLVQLTERPKSLKHSGARNRREAASSSRFRRGPASITSGRAVAHTSLRVRPRITPGGAGRARSPLPTRLCREVTRVFVAAVGEGLGDRAPASHLTARAVYPRTALPTHDRRYLGPNAARTGLPPTPTEKKASLKFAQSGSSQSPIRRRKYVPDGTLLEAISAVWRDPISTTKVRARRYVLYRNEYFHGLPWA